MTLLINLTYSLYYTNRVEGVVGYAHWYSPVNYYMYVLTTRRSMLDLLDAMW